MNEAQEVYKVIEDIRRAYPDLTIGQIIVNAVSAMNSELSTMTDKELKHALEDYLTLTGIFTATV